MPRKKKEQSDNYVKAFPKAIRELMEQRKTTQNELADYLQKTRQAVSYYCDGSSSPDWETLVKVADYFDVSADYLLGRTKDPDRNPSASDELGLSVAAVQWLKQLANSFDNGRYTQHFSVLLEMSSFQTLIFSLIEYFSALKASSVTANILKTLSAPTGLYSSDKTYQEKLIAETQNPQYDDMERQFLRAILAFDNAYMNFDMSCVLDDENNGIHILDILELKIKRNLDSLIRDIEDEYK